MPIANWYCDMSRQRITANRSKICNCCTGERVREQRPWPKPDDPHYLGAICPTCDTAPRP